MDSASHTAEASDLPAQGPIQDHLRALQQNLEQSLHHHEQHFKQLAGEIEAKAKAAAGKVASGAAELRKVLGVADVTPTAVTTTKEHFGSNPAGNVDVTQGEGVVAISFGPQNPLEQSVQHHSKHQGRVTGLDSDEGAYHQRSRNERSRYRSPTDDVRRMSRDGNRLVDRTRRGRHTEWRRRSRSRERSLHRSRSRSREGRSRVRRRSKSRSRSKDKRSCVGRRSRSRSRSRDKRSRVGRRGRSRSKSGERQPCRKESRGMSEDRDPHHENGSSLNESRSSRGERETSRNKRLVSNSRSSWYDNVANHVLSTEKKDQDQDPWKGSLRLDSGMDQMHDRGWMKWPSILKDGST